jgi:hypothetical protein
MECLEELDQDENFRLRLQADVHQRLLDLREDGVEVYVGSTLKAWIQAYSIISFFTGLKPRTKLTLFVPVH